MQTLLQLPCGNALRRPHAAIAARPVAVALCKNLHNGVWNFGSPAPLYGGTCKIQNRNMAETLRCSIFEHFAVVRKNAQRYRIDSPVGDPQCSLARSCEPISKLILADVLGFRVTPATS